MKTFFVVFSFIMCSDCDNYQIYKNEIKLAYNGDVLMAIFEFDMHTWAIMGDHSSNTFK